jgi:integrase
MKSKFDPKTYQNKERVYRPIPGANNILRLWVWSKEKEEYRTPERGNVFDARRYEYNEKGGRRRVKRTFETLEEARAWQSFAGASRPMAPEYKPEPMCVEAPSAGDVSDGKPRAPTFAEVVANFRENAYPSRARGTQIEYDKMLRLHFALFMPMAVTSITPKVVDEWLRVLKKRVGLTPQSTKRVSFEKELDLLALILRYFDKYNDDVDFRFPIKTRHREDMFVRRDTGKRDRDLPRADFEKVRAEMLAIYGESWWALFTIQWRQALRISEAAALHWEDVHLNWREPEKSFVTICRHMEWTKVRTVESRLAPGFKNSASTGGKKVLPLFPESFEALKKLYFVGAKGLVFKDKRNSFLEYRTIQWRYENAFAKAGVEYRGTHALRHGGCREVYNQTGDLAVAGMLLGNQDSDTVRVYARRDPAALVKVAETAWHGVSKPQPPAPDCAAVSP